MARTGLAFLFLLLQILSQGSGSLIQHAGEQGTHAHQAAAPHVHLNRGLLIGHSHGQAPSAASPSDAGRLVRTVNATLLPAWDHDRDAIYLSPADAQPETAGSLIDHLENPPVPILFSGVPLLLVAPPTRPNRLHHPSVLDQRPVSAPIYLRVRSLLI